MYFTYILQSTTSGIIYIGQTNNIEDRLRRHNSNQNKWTKNKGPWKLLFSQQFATRSEAMAMEKKLKSFKNKTYLLDWIVENKQIRPKANDCS
jgi:putative endonuclease